MCGYLVNAYVTGKSWFSPFARINPSTFSQTSMRSILSLTHVLISSLVSRRIRPESRNFSSLLCRTASRFTAYFGLLCLMLKCVTNAANSPVENLVYRVCFLGFVYFWVKQTQSCCCPCDRASLPFSGHSSQ